MCTQIFATTLQTSAVSVITALTSPTTSEVLIHQKRVPRTLQRVFTLCNLSIHFLNDVGTGMFPVWTGQIAKSSQGSPTGSPTSKTGPQISATSSRGLKKSC